MPCFIRKPRGLDVYAACGQLKRMEQSSAGFSLLPGKLTQAR
jgi:23S rRNA (adenine2503-C2)-methyltransferase